MACKIAVLPALGDTSYRPVEDFAPISNVASAPFVLLVNTKIPARSLGEFVNYVRGQPGKIAYSSSGIGSLAHLAMALLLRRAGVDMIHVPYKGGAGAVTDLVAGHKTGLYLDQQVNYEAVSHFARGAQVLDCFSFLGGFGLHAARAGAAHVHMLDQSADAIAASRRNAEANGLTDKCSFETINVFDWLKAQTKTAPALIQSPAFLMSTPPVGVRRSCGKGARISLKYCGPRAVEGKTFTTSAPADQARRISVGVKAPGTTSLS